MKKILLSFLILQLGIVSLTYATGLSTIQQIKNNYRGLLVPLADKTNPLLDGLVKIEPETEIADQVVAELHQRYPFDLKKIDHYLTIVNQDGSWKDIDYTDTKRSGWEPKLHAERILELSKLYYSAHTTYYRSEKLKSIIHAALDYWFTTRPVCLNWWYNQIGVPKTLGAAFILLEEQLTEIEKDAAIKVMENSHFGMTGQNKVWLAGNVLIRGLLQNDEDLVKAARDTIVSEIVLGKEEGIKSDWSFHQHGPQQQFGNYGLAFVSGMSFFYSLFNDTACQFDEQHMEILSSLINKGYRWVIWNTYMDINALGRQLFHNVQLHKAYALAFAAANLDINDLLTTGNTLNGYKHFDDSDYTIYRSKKWMVSVKMASNRVIGTELVNEDNLKGYYMADGATYYYVNGDEYLNVFPFWDWRKIPGITSYEDTAPLPHINENKSGNKSDLVGGLDDGKCGMTAMELHRDGLKAYKVWLFIDNAVICLGAGIQSDTALCVTTSIDQRLKRNDLSVWNGSEWENIQGAKTFHQPEIRFFHDQTGYIILGNDSCVAHAEERTGRWDDFMKMYKPNMVKGEVMALHLRHGVKPREATYQYVVLPSTNKERVEAFNIADVKVIKNDRSAQIISVPAAGKGYWMAVYRTGVLNIDGQEYHAETPGIYYVEKNTDGWVTKQMKPFRYS